MDASSQCPHPNDCLKVGSCLDDLNAPLITSGQFPRRMTPAQANGVLAALQEGKTLRWMTNGGKLGPAIVSLTKWKKHCALYPEWGDGATRLGFEKGATLRRHGRRGRRRRRITAEERTSRYSRSASLLVFEAPSLLAPFVRAATQTS
jgi:hypothetical protein